MSDNKKKKVYRLFTYLLSFFSILFLACSKPLGDEGQEYVYKLGDSYDCNEFYCTTAHKSNIYTNEDHGDGIAVTFTACQDSFKYENVRNYPEMVTRLAVKINSFIPKDQGYKFISIDFNEATKGKGRSHSFTFDITEEGDVVLKEYY
jgi:hypothetical protein